MSSAPISRLLLALQPAAASRARPAAAGFAALLAGKAPAADTSAATAAGKQLPPRTTGAAGLTQAGASGAELVATKVQLAAALRDLQARLSPGAGAGAAAAGAAAETPVAKAAGKLVDLLGAFDAVNGTNALPALRKGLAKIAAAEAEPDAQTAPTDTTGEDGKEALAALFAGVGQLLGLARPAPAAPEGAAGRAVLLEAVKQGAEDGQGVLVPAAASAVPNAQPTAGLAAAAVPTGNGQPADASRAAPQQRGAFANDPSDFFDPRLRAVLEKALRLAPAAPDQARAGAQPTGTAAAALPQSAAQAQTPLLAALPAGASPFGAAPLAQAAASPPATAPQAHAAAVPTPAPPPGFAGVVTAQLRSADLSARHTRIALTPQGLGTIEFDLQHDKSGDLKVVVRADNPMVLTALRNDRDTLAGILSGSGLAASGNALDFQDLGQRDGGEERRGAPVAVGVAGEETEAPVPDVLQTIGNGRLDIRT
ncbi:flagellar hook-length control protein FliK [Acidimangrovimonas pyrenivorans]|uniref:Flagellar hook-length control protein FliK n=1 Tax=Acidimangrovimonas pyrenivorans TaxID=2030798 RepID=A0ABV7ANZ6_9RHOB